MQPTNASHDHLVQRIEDPFPASPAGSRGSSGPAEGSIEGTFQNPKGQLATGWKGPLSWGNAVL